MIRRTIPNPETGGTYALTAYTWAELEKYLATVNLGSVAPREAYMHHTYRPVAPANSTLDTIVNLTAGVLRYFWNQGWRPFGKGPHVFAGPPGAVVSWPVSLDGYHVVYHNRLTLGVEFMYDGEVGPAPQWAIDGWVRIARALTDNPTSAITRDRKHLRLHRDYTAGTTEAERMIDLAGKDFTVWSSRKSCPGRKVLEAQIYPPLWKALTGASPEDDMILVPIEVYPPATKAIFAGGTKYSLYRIANGAIERTEFTPSDPGSSAETSAKVTLNGDTEHAGILLSNGHYVGWVVSGWGPLPHIELASPSGVPQADYDALKAKVATGLKAARATVNALK